MYHIIDRVRACISIHALLAESDGIGFLLVLLTLNFYPRSPCGERPVFPYFIIIDVKISIHALLAESDVFSMHFIILNFLFLSTLSLRRATHELATYCRH